MRKIECSILGKKGFVILDDDQTYLGTINAYNGNNPKHKWFWRSANINGKGWTDNIPEAIDKMKFFKIDDMDGDNERES